jgi:Ca2+-binding EF-hand superfamily protein
MSYMDTNGDGSINLGDDIESDHLDMLVEYCDMDNNGSISECELHECIIKCENEWRLENCPEGYPALYCEPIYCP